jgi:hypothetical protein
MTFFRELDMAAAFPLIVAWRGLRVTKKP